MYREWKRQASTLVLPAVGPYASNGVVGAFSLSSVSITTITNITSTPAAPQTYNLLNVSGSATLQSANYGLFLWVNKIVMDPAGLATSYFQAKGGVGMGGITSGIPSATGGAGGSGGAGGGGGSATTFKGTQGGNGGPGAGAGGSNGFPGNISGSNAVAGAGGSGFKEAWTSAYAWGSGGNGGGAGIAGVGGVGFGGGGGGGSCTAGVGAAGGGNGGSGLICIIANECSGAGTFDASNDGVAAGTGTGLAGNQGGGGVIWLAFKKYDGLASALVTGFAAGTKSIFEITSSGTLVSRLFTDTWNNL